MKPEDHIQDQMNGVRGTPPDFDLRFQERENNELVGEMLRTRSRAEYDALLTDARSFEAAQRRS